MACGIYDLGVIAVEYVALDVSLESEHEPTTEINYKKVYLGERDTPEPVCCISC